MSWRGKLVGTLSDTMLRILDLTAIGLLGMPTTFRSSRILNQDPEKSLKPTPKSFDLSHATAIYTAAAAVGATYLADQDAVYVDVATTSGELPTNVAVVTTDFEIQLLQRVAVLLPPETDPRLTGVVSGHAPDQTVGPGI